MRDFRRWLQAKWAATGRVLRAGAPLTFFRYLWNAHMSRDTWKSGTPAASSTSSSCCVLCQSPWANLSRIADRFFLWIGWSRPSYSRLLSRAVACILYGCAPVTAITSQSSTWARLLWDFSKRTRPLHACNTARVWTGFCQIRFWIHRPSSAYPTPHMFWLPLCISFGSSKSGVLWNRTFGLDLFLAPKFVGRHLHGLCRNYFWLQTLWMHLLGVRPTCLAVLFQTKICRWSCHNTCRSYL